MNDDPLNREIEEALAAEPSPQFLARVRRQLSNEPQRSRRMPWMVLSAGLATAALLVGVVVFRPGPSQSLPPEEVVVTRVPVDIPSSTPPATGPKAVSGPTQPRQVKLEVLIDPREAAALKRFISDVQEQKIDPSKLEGLFAAVESSNADAIEPMPIVIEPLNFAATERGGNL